MATTEYTEAELADLTDEEREAIQEDDGSGEEAQAGSEAETEQAQANEGEEGEEGAEAKPDAKPEGEEGKDKAEGEEAAAAEGTEGEQAKAGEGEEQEQEPAPRAEVPLLNTGDVDVNQAKQNLESLAPKKDELIQKFDDGDLTPREYQQQLDALNKQERELERAIDKASIAKEMADNQAKQSWMDTVTDFVDQHPEYREKQILWNALDSTVVAIAKSDEAQQQGWTGRQILQKAHDRITEELGLDQQGNKAADMQAKQQAQQQQEQQTPPKGRDVPPTLGRVPAAEGTQVDEGKWAKLDRLQESDPLRYEQEVAKLPEGELEDYLASQ